jgi:predicted MFS family arabinose efflux permease
MTPGKDSAGLDTRERLLRVLSAATFLIFFQAYMVAPLIPHLSTVFAVSGQTIGLIVPSYMIPYGISTLFYGLLSDRLGRRRIMLASLLAFVILTALTATAQSASQMILSGVLGLLWPFQRLLGEAPAAPTGTIHDLFAAYGSLLRPGRGRRTYAYVLLNAIFHSGVFTWLGLYFTQRYGLGEVGIGLALLGYGVPGFLLGPPIGRAADR